MPTLVNVGPKRLHTRTHTQIYSFTINIHWEWRWGNLFIDNLAFWRENVQIICHCHVLFDYRCEIFSDYKIYGWYGLMLCFMWHIFNFNLANVQAGGLCIHSVTSYLVLSNRCCGSNMSLIFWTSPHIQIRGQSNSVHKIECICNWMMHLRMQFAFSTIAGLLIIFRSRNIKRTKRVNSNCNNITENDTWTHARRPWNCERLP